jgi:hypothetical protein
LFRLAKIEDGQQIIDFLRAHWNPDHVYVRFPKLFYHDFQQGKYLNFGLMEIGGVIKGIFGYFFYNNTSYPDIGGMLWQVTPDIQRRIPLAGLQLRQFVLQQVKHRFFGSPGANPQTRVIYQRLGMIWAPMEHFAGTDKQERWPTFVKVKGGVIKPRLKKVCVKQLIDTPELRSIDDKIFEAQTPIKDINYIERRFLKHPFRNYQIWLVKSPGAQNVVVTRRQNIKDLMVLRVIDVLGNPDCAAGAICAVFDKEKHCCSYVDFVAYGFKSNFFTNIGFARVDFDKKGQDYVPNYFEPLVESPVQIFANCDSGYSATTMVKGNGDQDRPNDIKVSFSPNNP